MARKKNKEPQTKIKGDAKKAPTNTTEKRPKR